MTDEKKIQVLLVDDEESLCGEVAKTLSREGFTIEYKLTAEKGLEYLEKNPETDIVLLDIYLGPGLSGIEGLKDIRKKFKYVQVIMLTGEKDINVGIECMKNGAYDYMTKPFKKEVFLEKARGAIEKKKLSQLGEKEKLSLIVGMAQGIAHQINNRLNEFSIESGEIILELSDLVENNKEYIDKNPEFKKAIDYVQKTAEEISNNVKKTGNVIKGISNYANIKSKGEKFSSFPLKEVLDNAIELMKLNNKLEKPPVKVTSFPDIQEIYAIEPLFHEAIYGILQNAYEALQIKKVLAKSESGNSEEQEIVFTITNNPDSCLIQIRDNGVGIREEDKQKIYAPYFTTKATGDPGIGTGLYVIRRIIEEDHKGKLLFESSYMNGTTFFIELPKEKHKDAVLLVDDEEDTVTMLAKSLQRCGIQTLIATRGVDAIRLYKEHTPDYVFLDLSLPDIGGLNVLKEIKQIDQNAKVYFMTGNAGLVNSEVKATGAIDCIVKPVTAKDLIDKIRKPR